MNISHTSNTKNQAATPSRAFWTRFRGNSLAYSSLVGFIILILTSLLAPLVAHDRPLIVVAEGHWFFPALFDYPPETFGKKVFNIDQAHSSEAANQWLSQFVIDYWAIKPDLEAHAFTIWPPLEHRPNESNLAFSELPAPMGSSIELTMTSPISQKSHSRVLTHYLGTDTSGRDLLTRLIYGCRTSLLIALGTTLISFILGILLGLVMGYRGGWFDMIVGRLLEAIGYFPVIFMIIVLVAFLENPGIAAIMAIFIVLNIAPFTFYMRGQVLSAKKMLYVEAAQAMGQKPFVIMIKHILPNTISPLLVLIPFTITSDISFLATIDFLGFGVQPPTASLGALLRSGFDQIEHRWWLVLNTSILLISILILVNCVGEGVRDGLDPHAVIHKKALKKWLKTGSQAHG